MPKKTPKGLERVEIYLHPTVKKEIRVRAKKVVPPVSPKQYVEKIINEHVNPHPAINET